MAMSKNHQLESLNNNGSSLFTIEEIDERIQQLLAENAELRNTLQQNNTYMRLLISTLTDWQNEVDRIHVTYREKFEKAKEVISKLKQENSFLKQKIESTSGAFATQENFSPGSPNQDFRVLDDFVLVNHEPHSIATTNLGLQNSDFKQNKKSFNGNLSFNGEEHQQKSLNVDSNENSRLIPRVGKQLREKSSPFAQSNMNALNESKYQELEKTNNILNQQCRELSEKISSLNARLSVAEELVLSKQTQNTELLMEVARLEKAAEVMPVLQAQLELYQSDFEAEREARQSLAGEKDAMAQELRILKRKLDALQANAATSGSASAREPETPESYECPKCNFKYSTFESLNNHLDECLNQQMFPV